LFSALVNDPRELLQDYIERPEAYPHEILPILMALVSKTKEEATLTPEEQLLLNASVTTYAERSVPSRKSTSATTDASTRLQPSEEDEDELEWGDEEKELEWGDAPILSMSAEDVGDFSDPLARNDEAPREISLEDFVPDTSDGWWLR
jgi:hypothetical protein